VQQQEHDAGDEQLDDRIHGRPQKTVRICDAFTCRQAGRSMQLPETHPLRFQP
jgi:hypothetical protein